MKTAAVGRAEGKGAWGGKHPVFQPNTDDPNWCGWDQYNGDRGLDVPKFKRPLDPKILRLMYYRVRALFE